MKIKPGKLLGTGAGSDVYEYETDKVIKLYKKDSKGSVDREYRVTLDAYNNGLSVPKIYGIIEYNGRKGIIMERIYGTSYKDILFNHIIESYNKGMNNSEIFNSSVNIEIINSTAKVYSALHQKKCNLKETTACSLKSSCKNNHYISQKEKEIIIKIIDKLPVSDNICHGDPNAGNLIVQNDKIFLIDWNNCVKGSPLYDLTEYMLMMEYIDYDLSKMELPKYILNYFHEYKNEYTRIFLDFYVRETNIDLSSMDMWIVPMLVAKMGGNNSVEKQEALLNDIRKGLNSI